MGFLHCKDLPLWAEILLHTEEDRDLEGRDESLEQEHPAKCESGGRSAWVSSYSFKN